MAIERAHARAVQKPWGSVDLRPWGAMPGDGIAVGELWYERRGDEARSRLLLKMLFTTQPLSVQVHPDDSHARSMGLPSGKTEAWYVVSAAPGAKVAVGLKNQTTAEQLRSAIGDGSIVDLLHWRTVVQDDVIFVPAGTIHAIGPGLTIAEIQQRSDATFRMFDYGSGRQLRIADAVAVANPGPAEAARSPIRYTHARSLLIVDPHFVFERINLMPGTSWDFRADQETWLLVLRGCAQAGSLDLSVADAVLIDGEQVRMDVGDQGLRCLVAYPGPQPASDLLRTIKIPATDASLSADSRLQQLRSAISRLQQQDTPS